MTDHLSLGHPCPVCRRVMHPRVLACECGIKIEGPIQVNEFAVLSPELLQFLRIFILNEGRIRDMEAALGVSYPTVKARIRELKLALHLTVEDVTDDNLNVEAASAGEGELSDVLSKLEDGDLSADEAIKRLS